MLRITRTQDADTTSYRLEGKLLGPWVDELASSLAVESTPLQSIQLDLTNVTYADCAGAALLRSLVQRGARIAHCSSFVAILLEVESQ
jgi:ABC-type transporter Mla MlaB component